MVVANVFDGSADGLWDFVTAWRGFPLLAIPFCFVAYKIRDVNPALKVARIRRDGIQIFLKLALT